jgi:hypothetical protein
VDKLFDEPIQAGRLLFMPGLLWDAVIKDCTTAGKEPQAYLASVRAKIVSLFTEEEADGLPRIVNHETTLAALRELGIGEGVGTLTLLTGPRSIGKTLMLNKLAAEFQKDTANKRRMIVFDARQHGADLARGIVRYLTKDESLLKTVLEVLPASVDKSLESLACEIPGIGLVKADVGAVAGGHGLNRFFKTLSLEELVHAFLDACHKRGEIPIIVIDEANHALSTDDRELQKRTKDLRSSSA